MEAIEKIDFEKVGKRMKKLRKEQRISQEQVAKDLGSTISFVSNLENNYTKINLRVLLYYSKMCHVSIDYLLNA
ncbi:MAG: helix-turn-helix domain-containing protein, partial [Eubacterium sp.]